MKHKTQTVFALLLVFVLAFGTAASAIPVRDAPHSHSHDEESEAIDTAVHYITDDSGNYFRVTIDPDGDVIYDPITEDEMLAYLYGIVPAGYLVSVEGNTFSAITEDGVGAITREICPPDQHKWGAWQQNPSFCFRNCSKCGEVQRWTGHYIDAFTPVNGQQHKISCSQCGWVHGYAAHNWMAIPPNLQVCTKCGYSS